MDNRLRTTFDQWLEDLLAELPDHLHEALEEVPVIVEDEPSAALLREMDMEPGRDDLCGLHWGVALPDRSLMGGSDLPGRIMLFRGPIIRLAQAMADEWAASPDQAASRSHGGLPGEDGVAPDAVTFEDILAEQIWITLLHEIGHHFGLDEDDLAELGYA